MLVMNFSSSGYIYLSNLTDVNGSLFFTTNHSAYGNELWKSDGTTNGTFLIKDISSVGSNPSYLKDVNGTLFFRAQDGVHGYEIWKSDGTTNGTILVKDIYPGSSSSYPQNLTEVNGTLFFRAQDPEGYELWKIDLLQ